MKHFKNSLLLATAIASFGAMSAQAQVAIPAPGPNDSDNSLHGAGASSIQNVLVQELNCIGVDHPLGTSGGAMGALVTEPAAMYTPTSPSAANPAFDCASQNVQPNFSAKYVATGSGFGKQIWRLFSDQFDPTTAGVHNPFNEIAGDQRWSHVQFGFSDSNVSPSDIQAFNANAGNSTNLAGPAIVFPKYVLPVAIAYNPVYGVNAAGTNMTFNVKKPQSINGVVAGGLPLSRVLYCKVFNGDIKNFNDPAFKAANVNTTLQDTVNDTAARFNSDGVPIRLVGRLDRSGTTDVFTRHLAQVCTGLTIATNKYAQHAETLPYDSSTGVNFSNVRADTGLQPGTASKYPLAGTINSVSGDYFNGTAITYNGAGPTSSPSGNVGSGLYLVADGSGKLSGAINLAPDYVLNTKNGNVTLNGKIGYIGADFVKPSANATLFAAALQVNGTGASYLLPSAANAVLAFGTGTGAILPPQSTATGAFNTTDTRQVLLPDGTTGNATRDNPIAWAGVLYANSSNTLAAPKQGYPITGTTQFLGYTCYAPTSNRYNIVEYLALNFGLVTKTSTNANFSNSTFKGTAPTSFGILAQSNIGVVPTAYQNAIAETFLKKSTQTSNGVALATYGNNGNGLYIQTKYLLTAADANPAPSPQDAQSNPGCKSGAGA